MTGAPQTDPPPPTPIAVRVEADPPPVVRALANDLVARLTDPEFAEATATARGTVNVSDRATPQAATIELGEGGIRVGRGLAEGADVRVSLDLRGGGEPTLDGEAENPRLALWAHELLGVEPDPWPEAATRFWAVLSTMAGAPEVLRVVDVDSGDELWLGAREGRAYELPRRPRRPGRGARRAHAAGSSWSSNTTWT